MLPYEFEGEAYKQSSSHQKEWGNKIISEFHFKGNERILDLGCGDGALTVHLAELVPNGFVLGIDSSKGMIATAQKLALPNLAFKHQDISALNFTDDFDLVFSNATLHWVKDHDRLLKATFRCLRKTGLVRFNFAADGNCQQLFKVAKQAMVQSEFSGFFQSFIWPWYMPTLAEYETLVKRSKFCEIKVWGENADRYFHDKETMIKWIDQPSLVPFLEYLPAEQKKEFRDYVVEHMIQETLQVDGTCFETFRRVNLSCRKP